MNAPEAVMKDVSYDKYFQSNEMVTKMLFGESETLCSYETLQFEDYSKFVFEMLDPSTRVKRREQEFPKDLQNAYDMGVRFTS